MYRAQAVVWIGLAVAAAAWSQPVRPADQFAIGDLVEDRSHGNQIVEVAGGIHGDGGYSVLIPGAGGVPVARRNLKLMARADAPVKCPFGEGDIVEFSHMNVRERGVITRAIGGFCQVRTSSSEQFEEFARLKLVRKAATAAPVNKPGTFTPGQTVQVRTGAYWIPAVAGPFDAATGWYAIQFPNAAAQMIPPRAYASAAVLRIPTR